MSGKSEKNEPKTVAMHLLDAAGVKYEARSYAWSEEDLSGVHAAEVLGEDPARVFKTLVARGIRTGGRAAAGVFCIPVAESLDLKNAPGCWEKSVWSCCPAGIAGGHGVSAGRMLADRHEAAVPHLYRPGRRWAIPTGFL